MGILISIWAWAEPLIFLIQFLFGWRFKFHTRNTERQFETLFAEAFQQVKIHLQIFGVDNSIKGSEDIYKAELKKQIKLKNELYIFLDGEIHLKLFKLFHLPTDKRINKFIINCFFFLHGFDKMFKYLFLKERYLSIIGNKNTFLHYLSINDWKNTKAKVLQIEIVKIKKVNPLWNDRYIIPKNENLAKDKPNITKAIDRVLAKGFISEKSIFNLASSEKLVFIHKYGEGFSNVFNTQKNQLIEAKEKLAKWKKSTAKNATKMITVAQKNIESIDSDWLRVPIAHSLEDLGFQKLFSKMDGVYVLPLSMLPERYHNQISLYIEEVVITKAQNYIDRAIDNKNPFIDETNRSLKYLILSHIVPVNEIDIITQERTIEISSRTLSRMLFTSFLSKDNSQISSLYINDIVRNVDFKSLLKTSKTDLLIEQNFELIKQILWTKFEIDIFKPFMLSTLLENTQNDIVNAIVLLDNNFKRASLSKRFKEIVQFYKDLNDELNAIKK